MSKAPSLSAVCAVVSVAAGLMGCGGSTDTDSAKLTVTQVFRPAQPIAIEGSATALTVTNGDEVIARVRTGIAQASEPEVIFEERVEAGAYEVAVAHHACYGPGNCFIPGEKSILRCSANIEIDEGRPKAVTVRVSNGFPQERQSECAVVGSDT